MENKENIIEIKIEEEMQTAYLDYAMSVIVGRALPDVRDGLKHVHRRALYTMHEMSNYWNRPYKKSARVVGDVMGKYHPHGDTAIYDTIVRLAQDFTMRYPLVDGQGNFGSIDGDSPAAMRYTEVRMSKITNEILADIEKDTVDFVPNYDGSTKEPAVLPSRIPNLLINGSSGIAVGMATNIPPHNLTEVIDGLVQVIRARLSGQSCAIEDLMKIIKGPDFPTAAYILGRDGIRSAYKTGRGIVRMRAKIDIEEGKRDKEMIIISEIPYQVNKAKLVEKIATLVRDKKIEGISDIRDESDRKGMRVVIECRKGENVQVIVNRLYKLTQLTDTFGVIMLALHNGQPKVMNLKEYLEAFVDHRRNIIIRRSQFDLKKAEARAHILEGLLKAIDNIDEIVALIKASKNPDEARSGLIAKFSFSEIQAQAILDMRLQRLTGLERDKLENELGELKKLIIALKELLASDKLQLEKIIEESEEIKTKFGDKRRTEIITDDGDINEEDLIADEEMIVTITNQGYIKRVPPETYRAQKRGGMGIKGMTTNEEDFVTHLFTADTKSFMLIFSNLGKLYWLKIHQIPEGTRTSRGKTLASLLGLSSVEKVCSVFAVKNFDSKGNIVMATKQGVIKKTSLDAFSNPRAGGIIALKINPGDILVNAAFSSGTADILLCSKEGMSIRFSEDDVRPMGRTAAGVRGIHLTGSDEVVGMTVLEKEENRDILSVTAAGYGKRTESSEYRVQTRGGKGIITMKTTDKNGGEVISIHGVSNADDLMLISDKGQIVRIHIRDISTMGRNTQGVRLVRLKEGEKLVACQNLAEKESEEEPSAPSSES
ncbi:MAG: DNA gyrase subunit A [Oligoflexia bacterium]|nr:DNA gyrase subunit A [Oligoflexia bacterium]